MRRLAVAAVAAGVLAAACGGGGDGGSDAPAAAGFAFAQSDVVPGTPIERRFTCDGDDVPPALRWQGVPDGTAELALVVDDRDANGFTHWLVYGLAADAAEVPAGAAEGRNDFGEFGYGGPCPPRGETHTYVFRLLALDRALELPAGADRGTFDAAVEGHVLAEAELQATYKRP